MSHIAYRSAVRRHSRNAACHRLSLSGLALVTALSHGAPAEPSRNDRALLLDGVAALVNDEIITIADVMRKVPPSEVAGAATREERDRLLGESYRKVLGELIDRMLIVQAFRNSGGQLLEGVVDQRAQEILDENFGGKREKLMVALEPERMTYEDWLKNLEEGIIVSQMTRAQVWRHVSVSPEAVREYYRNHPGEFVQTAATHVRLIVIRPRSDEEGLAAARLRAEEALNELQAGKPFAEVAISYSQGAHAAEGGDWGWVRPAEDLRPELAAAIAVLQPGQWSELLELPEEWYIVYKEAVRKEGVVPLETVWDDIYAQLREEQAKGLYDEWIARLRGAAQIKLFDLP